MILKKKKFQTLCKQNISRNIQMHAEFFTITVCMNKNYLIERVLFCVFLF